MRRMRSSAISEASTFHRDAACLIYNGCATWILLLLIPILNHSVLLVRAISRRTVNPWCTRGQSI